MTRGPRLQRLQLYPGRRRDHEPARLGLPIGVADGAAFLPYHPVVPPPDVGVDGLSHGPQDRQGGEVVLGGVVVPELHQVADEGGAGVELRHAVVLYHPPYASRVGVLGGPLVHDAAQAVDEGAEDDVAVPSHPPDVCGAPPYIPLVHVEAPLQRRRDVCEVAPRGDLNPLRLSRGPRSVQDVEDVLGLHLLGLHVA